MNFASKYVYAYHQPEFEYVSEEEYDHGMSVSEGSSDEDDEVESKSAAESRGDTDIAPGRGADVPPAPTRPPRQKKKKSRKEFSWKKGVKSTASEQSARKFRRADTNVVSISLNQLVAPSNMFAGDPVRCTQCDAVLSHLATLESDGTDRVWTCDFCEERNLVDIDDEEIPKTEEVTFLVEPAPATAATGLSGLDESLVIFCVDVSGSMCVTTEVPGRLNLRGTSRLQRMQSFNNERADQYLPRQRRDVTYVSRLQAVQAAVDHQLEDMQKEHPSRRVALITFDNEVTVIGDGTEDETSVVGDKLTNQDALTELGKGLNMPKSIKETRKSLGEKLFNLEEGGATALGPALVVAVSMASRHLGSKVIICTDGMANVGMGKLDEGRAVTENEEENFYETIGTTAMSEGVAISIVTIKGTDCKLVELGKLADRTGGQVNIVDPLKLAEEFSTILADRIIATNVVATFILHKQLYINDVDESKKESRAVREVGNVTSETEITFEYSVRADKPEKPAETAAQETGQEAAAGAGPSTSAGAEQTSTSPPEQTPAIPKELPFQLQISYTDTEGMKALRVLTKKQPVTYDRNLAEQNVAMKVLGINAAQQAANLALQGEYTMARGVALMNQRLAWRHARSDEGEGQGRKGEKKAWYRKVFGKIKTVENHMHKAQISERSRFGTTYSDDEEEEAVMGYEGSTTECKSKKKKAKKSRARTSEIADDMANDVYSHARITSSKFD